jgi:hypothetical protein
MSTVVRTVVRRAGRTLTTGVALGGLVATSLALDGAGERAVRRSVTADAMRPVASTVATVATHHRTGKRWPGHPGRRVISYRVRSGDTASRIAVRFHAWTAELLAINHKTSASFWYVGEKVKVPVVTARAGHHTDKKKHHPAKKHPRHKAKKNKKKSKPHHTSHSSRARVRDEVKRVAREHGVNPHMALAIAWQESGWQQDVRSSVGAVGAMQVMPKTGRWISVLVGRRLHLRRLHDNVLAGVVLYELLRRDHSVRGALAGYYQGLGSVHAHGMYKSTKRYIRNVKQLKRALDHGWRPLH